MALGNKQVMADNIQYYLAKNAKSASDMIRDLEFKSTTVYDWINARTYPRIDKIEMMSNYFGIDKSDLVEERGNNPLKEESANDLKKYFDEHPVLKFDGKEIPDAEMKIIKRILEDMDD